LRQDQSAIVSHPARMKMVAMGRRWGKTFMAGTYALACADLGGAVAWVAPTYRNAKTLWRFAERFLARANGKVRINKVDMEISFPSGGRLGIYSADQDIGLRGEDFDLVIMDECARIREETYLDTIIPTLADRDGKLLAISTPKGRNWFWREWQRGNAEKNDEICSWRASSSDNPNPLIKKAAQRARDTLPDRNYRQEWLAEFLEDGAGVFRGIRDAAISVPADKPVDGHSYVCGIDWGRVTDWTVISIIDVTRSAQVRQERFLGMDYAWQKERMRTIYETWKPHTMIAEANSMGSPLIEELSNDGLPIMPFWTNAKSKMTLIDGLALGFEKEALTILDEGPLVAELESYEATRLEGGILKYSAPSGMHDDCVIALALAWQAAASPPAAGSSLERDGESPDQNVTLDSPRFRRRSSFSVRRASIGGRRW
jgi:hypothetical protein